MRARLLFCTRVPKSLGIQGSGALWNSTPRELEAHLAGPLEYPSALPPGPVFLLSPKVPLGKGSISTNFSLWEALHNQAQTATASNGWGPRKKRLPRGPTSTGAEGGGPGPRFLLARAFSGPDREKKGNRKRKSEPLLAPPPVNSRRASQQFHGVRMRRALPAIGVPGARPAPATQGPTHVFPPPRFAFSTAAPRPGHAHPD